VKIIVGSWFKLPRLGGDVFAALMKAGVKYETGMGFMLTSDTDRYAALRVIESALGDDVDLSLRCIVCLREACPGCPFIEDCDRSKVSSLCLCDEHSSPEGAYARYVSAFEAGLAD
jgi:hypothetical protein